MRKIFIILCISYLAHLSVYAEDTNTDVCETASSGYELYKCRVEKVCDQYKATTPVYKPEDYLEASKYLNILDTQENAAYIVLEEAQKQYRSNIGKTYSCAMIQTQSNSLSIIQDELLDFQDSGKIKDIVGPRIDARNRKLVAAADNLECTGIDNLTVYNKRNILNETTHQACTYVTYLEYLREYYSSIPNILGLDTKDNTDSNSDGSSDVQDIEKAYSTSEISRLINNTQAIIDREIDHTYKVFPIAFQAYTEYENNYPLHFLLEVIREDFVLLRRKLHEGIMPIAQVGYKIINAMIK